MTDHRFDSSLVSGYLDGELTQQDAQRVRIHLEDCAKCRTLAQELTTMKEATMSTRFRTPSDHQWDETATSPLTGGLRRVGWLLAIVWLAFTTGYGIWQVVEEADDIWGLVVAFGMWVGLGMVFFSVAVDQVRRSKNDRYRSVRK